MSPSKDNEFSLSPEIDRLSSQLAKDPKSKLFMPLAEEYIKSGMAEEAIMTIEEGLKVHPAYMSARVLLGKAFLEKNDLVKAREQFETVVKAVPDNLFAHKKLGELYTGLGMHAEAKRSYKMVLMLHPRDPEATQALEMLEGGIRLAATPGGPEKKPEQPAPKVFDLTEAGDAEAGLAEDVAGAEGQPVEDVPAVVEMPVPEMETLEQVKRSEAVEESVPSEEAGGFEFAAEEEEEEAEPGPATYVIEEDGQPEEGGDAFTWAAGPETHELTPEVESDVFDMDSSPLLMDGELEEPDLGAEPAVAVAPDEVFGGMPEEAFDLGAPIVEEPKTHPQPGAGSGYALDLGEVAGVKDIFEAYKDEVPEEDQPSGANRPVYEIPEDMSAFAMEGFKLEPPADGPAPVEPDNPPERPVKEMFETETLAELYVSQGFHDRAINIYRNLAVERPDDLNIRQKLQEIYQLAHLSSTGQAASVGDVQAGGAAREQYTPVDFDALDGAGAFGEDVVSANLTDEGFPEAEVAPEEDSLPEAGLIEEGFPEAEVAEGPPEFGGGGFEGDGFTEVEVAGLAPEEHGLPEAGLIDDGWGDMVAPGGSETAGGVVQADLGAVGRLEGFLDKVRRKRAS